VADCSVLAAKRCSCCGGIGHTQTRCHAKRAEEEWKAHMQSLQRRKDRQADAALRRHEEVTTGWAIVGRLAVQEVTTVREVTAEAQAETRDEACAPCEIIGKSRASKAKRQAAKRVEAAALRKAAGLA